MAEVEIKSNLPELKSHLTRIGRELSSKVIRSATNAAAQVIKRKAISLAPVLQVPDKRRIAGALKRNIYVRRSKDRTTGREHYYVGFRVGKSRGKTKHADTFYGYFLEGGWIPRSPGRARRGGNRSRAAQRASDSGVRKQFPFLKPAFEATRNEAIAKFFATAERRIAKISAEKTAR